MSNNKPNSDPSATLGTMEEHSTVDEDGGKKEEEEKPHQSPTGKASSANGFPEKGLVKRKGRESVSGDEKKRKKKEKRKLPSREEISRIR